MTAAFSNALLCPGQALPSDDGPLGTTLHGFHVNLISNTPRDLSLKEQLNRLIALVEMTLAQTEGYTITDFARILEISEPEARQNIMSGFPVHAEIFKLRQRALHVYEEALRTGEFVDLLENSENSTSAGRAGEYHENLGRLMNESQKSLTQLYECSCPEIDEICALVQLR
ncbi:unnamed protein product [Clonostachys rosea]|uniref:Uncharacterized protein n=1 Tax=Bionectria ochroleuca TaxID=29856 RepID=A0ABY6UIM4_BIOOC|nr:unnamed protein product [Clonostachys rosea]